MMEKITTITGLMMPLAKNDVDTDLIIPAQYLTQSSKKGYGAHCFQRLRESDPQFVMNQARFSTANILVTGENFGCGSSREHAVWALQQAGIQVIVAQSFADIFASNSGKNGLLLIEQPSDVIQHLLQQAEASDYHLKIDVERCTMQSAHNEVWKFTLDPFQHYCFIHGLDELDYLLAHKAQIEAFQEHQHG
jgi:3-isopropylmalate/(R)-2-methylmalate dehydratase small subunit